MVKSCIGQGKLPNKLSENPPNSLGCQKSLKSASTEWLYDEGSQQ